MAKEVHQIALNKINGLMYKEARLNALDKVSLYCGSCRY